MNPYFDHTPGGIVQDFRRKAVTMLEEVGISVEFSHHETGPGQNEIDLRHADALQTADNVMTFRTVIKEVAYTRDLYATFMPKPFDQIMPAAVCTSISRFSRANTKRFLLRPGLSIVSQRRHGTLLPGCSSMPRSLPRSPISLSTHTTGCGAAGKHPVTCHGDHNNRSALVRVPLYKPNKMQADAH